MIRKKALQHEVIVWRDAWSNTSMFEPDAVEYGCYLVTTGFLVKENKDEVVVASEGSCGDGNNSIRFLHGIVKKNIVSRTSKQVLIPILGK